jgi:hypothetical protein
VIRLDGCLSASSAHDTTAARAESVCPAGGLEPTAVVTRHGVTHCRTSGSAACLAARRGRQPRPSARRAAAPAKPAALMTSGYYLSVLSQAQCLHGADQVIYLSS